MRIGFDAKRAFYNRSGLGNYSRFIIKSLANYCSENEYLLFTPKTKNSISFIPLNNSVQPVTPQNFIHKKLSSYWRSIAMAGDFDKNGVEIYHGLSGEVPQNISKSKVKSVVTIHDLIFLRYPELYKPIDRKIYEKKFRFACEHANKIIAISEQTRQDIIRFFNVNSNKIEVVYQSCDLRYQKDYSEEDKENVRKTYDLPDEYLLYVGTIEKRKNLLSVVKAIHHGKINAPLVVVGRQTPYFEEVSAFIRQNHIKNIHFLEGVTNDNLPVIYQMAKIFIYPSVFEGFGIPILEALFSKVPVITSTGSCFPEAGGPSSEYVRPEDHEQIAEKINVILSDSLLRKKMISDGLLHAENFSHEKLAFQLNNLYSDLLNE